MLESSSRDEIIMAINNHHLFTYIYTNRGAVEIQGTTNDARLGKMGTDEIII